MKRKLLTLLALMMMSTAAWTQERQITGTPVDKKTNEPTTHVTVQLLRTDSTFATGAVSNKHGAYTLKAPANGRYLLKLLSTGYIISFQNIYITKNESVKVGQTAIRPDVVMLKEARATGQTMKVVVKEDTFVYNASAYRTPEGSVAEELVRRIPGAQVDGDGKITISGKGVKKIRVDGKEFMVGDAKTAMKDLPANAVERIRACDEKSGLARVTGIDDDNEETVPDFGLKHDMNKGMISNVDLAVGTKDRYAERLMVTYFKDSLRIMTSGNTNNTNDMGFGRRDNLRGGRNGLNANKMVGLNLSYEKRDTLRINGSAR